MSNALKTASADIIAAEEDTTREPIELYEFTNIGVDADAVPNEIYYYTSGDQDYTIPPLTDDPDDQGTTYKMEAIKRSAIGQSENLEAVEITIELPLTATVLEQYLMNNPLNKTTVEIKRTFDGLDTTSADSFLTIYYGYVIGLQFQGVKALLKCASPEYLIKHPAPRWKFNLTCNWKLGDSRCGVDLSGYKETVQVAVSADGKTLTAAGLGSFDDDYFALGYVEYRGRKALVVTNDKSDNTVTMMHALPGVESVTGEDDPTVDIYPGCCGSAAACAVFSNLDHFGGFPLLPPDNPSQWKWDKT